MRYPKEVRDFIAANVAGRSAEELAQMVNSRFGTSFTKEKIKSYKANHHLQSGTPCGIPKGSPSKTFPQKVVEYIVKHHKGVSRSEMAAQLNEHFGTAYTAQQIAAYYKNHGLKNERCGRFEPGHTPLNKGRKGYCAPGSEKGWYGKGHAPWNKLPIGSEVIKHDGYLWRKLGEGARDWRQVHLLNWEAAYGPVPEGHKLIFLDGDRTNCALDNLKMVTNDVNLEMNRSQLRFNNAELTGTGAAVAELKVATARRVLHLHECEFADGKCPHGGDAERWLRQPYQTEGS